MANESAFRISRDVPSFSVADQSGSSTKYVRITIDLEKNLLDWIDGLCLEAGFKSRGLIISELIYELVGDLERESATSPAVSDG